MAEIYTHRSHIAKDVAEATDLLEKKLSKELNNVEGKLWIIPSPDFNVATGVHDVDLILIGYLEDYVVDDIAGHNDIQVQSFITTIEVKSHGGAGIYRDGTHLWVKYPGGDKDVTSQSQQQKQTVFDFLKETLQYRRIPRISNIIWLTGIDYDDFDRSIGLTQSNIITEDFNIEEMFDAIGRTHQLKDGGYINAFSGFKSSEIADVANIFCKRYDGADSMTLRRINLFQQNNPYLTDLSQRTERVIVLSGHAGTGKTIMLLTAANQLMQQGYKCLYLTYNNALISDLKHTISIMKGKMLDIQMETMHSFLISILYKQGLWKAEYSIKNNFGPAINTLLSRINSISPIETYDYVFIDEAQDWAKPIPEVLQKLFRTKHLVIADGVDQFMQSSEQADWGSPFIPTLKKCLRQKRNLAVFTKIFASKLGVYWNIEPNNDFPGGKVLIYETYDEIIHDQLTKELKQKGCTEYDMMLLASNSFAQDWEAELKGAYNDAGINLFDGIDENNREVEYDIVKNQGESRIYTYESCRGLEAWTTVCLRFDELFTMSHPHDYNTIEYTLARNYMKTLWSLMPLTRAIDTLVLVVTADSDISKVLKEIAIENPDFVTYIEKQL